MTKYDRDMPCSSCPYRRDAPLGLWHLDEFVNLMHQNANPMTGAKFGCHEFNKKPKEEQEPCIGWLLDQKRRGIPSIPLRMQLITNEKAGEQFERISDEGLDLFDSIEEMCRANIRAMAKPKKKRRLKVKK